MKKAVRAMGMEVCFLISFIILSIPLIFFKKYVLILLNY